MRFREVSPWGTAETNDSTRSSSFWSSTGRRYRASADTWPESIKQRVLELRRLGLNYSEISRRTQVPYFTVLKWRDEKKAPSFEPLAVVPSRSNLLKAVTVTVPRSRPRPQPLLATVTVAMPGGIRIEGVDIEFLLRLFPKLKGGVR